LIYFKYIFEHWILEVIFRCIDRMDEIGTDLDNSVVVFSISLVAKDAGSQLLVDDVQSDFFGLQNGLDHAQE
jgi:hypothetical protein